MSYQIKSTPFFQRILTTSKLNGQLQMLKEEYERLNFLNDYKIEKKMREVRLKRLFKEIDEIRETNSKKPKLQSNSTTGGKDSKRFENLRKARNLGQYYSERNLENTVSDVNVATKRKVFQESKTKTKFEQKTSVLKKGIKYGNEISNWNIQNIKLKNLQKELMHKTIQKRIMDRTDVTDNNYNIKQTNTEKYNSTHTHKNKFYANKSVSPKKCIATTSVVSLSENVQLIDLENGDDNIFKSCDNLHETILVDNANIEVKLTSRNEYIKVNPAMKRWHKLFTIIECLIRMSQHLKSFENLKNVEDKPCIEEYQLRSISNGTNLLETSIIPSRTEQFDKNLIEKDEDNNNERLINSEYLIEENLPKSVDDQMPRYPPPPPSPPSPPPIFSPTFSHGKHSFTPIMKSSDDNYIEACDSKNANFKVKVQDLRSLFEYHNNSN